MLQTSDCQTAMIQKQSLGRIYTVKYLILKSRDVSRSRLHLCGNITD